MMLAHNPACVLCGRPGQHVDHKIPVRKGGEWFAEDNLQVLCHSCHSKKTRQEGGG